MDDSSGLGDAREATPRIELVDHCLVSDGVLVRYLGADRYLEVPSCVTSIGANAFRHARSLEYLVLPQGLSLIGSSAFRGCLHLRGIQLPESVKHVGVSAFRGCASLKRVALPDGLEEIAPRLFAGCSSLEEIRVPSNLRIVRERAFSGCRSLVTLVLPGTVERVCSEAFRDCDRLACLTVATHTEVSIDAFTFRRVIDTGKRPTVRRLPPSKLDGARLVASYTETWEPGARLGFFPDGIDDQGRLSLCTEDYAIREGAMMRYFGSAERLRIPEGVVEIRNAFEENPFGRRSGLFSEDIVLREASLPKSLRRIGTFAFAHCARLEHITLPVGLQEIGTCAFFGCRSLHDVMLPRELRAVGSYAFDGCESVGRIGIPSSVSRVGKSAFGGCEPFFEQLLGSAPDTLAQWHPFALDGTPAERTFRRAISFPTREEAQAIMTDRAHPERYAAYLSRIEQYRSYDEEYRPS